MKKLKYIISEFRNSKLSYILIIMVILLFSILSSCNSSSSSVNKDLVTEAPYRVGTDGVKIAFLTDKGLPPKQTYDQSQVVVGIRAQNLGATDTQAMIVMSYLTDQFEFKEATLNGEQKGKDDMVFDIFGKSQDNPVGDYNTLLYTFNSKPIRLKESDDVSFRANVCYPYQSSLISSVCIESSINDFIKKGECESKTLTFSGQGAPVAITKVEPLFIPLSDGVKPTFKITIQNKGDGSVIDRSTITSICKGESITKDTYNLIDIKAVLSKNELKCNPSRIKLINGVGTTVCSTDITISKKPSYVTSLAVTLDYGYFSIINTDMTLLRSQIILPKEVG